MKQYKAYKDSGVEWIGEIPKHWDRIKFKYITTMMTCGHAATPHYVEQGGKPFLSAQNIKNEDISLSVLKFVTSELHEKLTKNHKVEKGDLLQVRVGGKDTIGQTAIFNLDFDVSIYVSLAHIKLNKLAFNGYIQFLCNSVEFKNYCGVLMKKGAGVANLNVSDVEIMRIPLPPLEEQIQIAKYLNYKKSNLDTIIAKKEQIISLLQEERTAIINQVVTKGLDPNVPMKDSGIEWLGEIPKHWNVIRVRYVFDIIKNISGQLGYDVLSITQKGIKIKDIKSGAGQLSMDYSKYQIVNKGDYAMNHMDLLTGFIDKSKYLGVTSPDYRVFRNKSEEGKSDYFLYIFQMCYYNKIFFPLGQGSAQAGRWRLPTIRFRNFRIPVPPINEQNKIVNFINQELMRIDNIISKTQQEIDLLKEYKTALINNVVTGKVDIREEVIN